MNRRVCPVVAAFLLGLAAVDCQAAPVVSYQQGYLERVDGIPVLHLNGTPREMGRQYGYLFGDQIADANNLIEWLAHNNKDYRMIPSWITKSMRFMIGWIFWRQFPMDTKDEILEIIEGVRMRRPAVALGQYDLAFMNSLIDMAGIIHAEDGFVSRQLRRAVTILGIDPIATNCDSFVAWGKRTRDGKTFQTQNVDLATGLGLERHPLVIVKKQTGKIPYVTASFAGLVGIFTGMNADGVALGQVWASSKDRAIGTPWSIQMESVFSEAHTSSEAVAIFRRLGNRTYGNNFVFADTRGERLAVEASPTHFEVFRDDDPREDRAQWHGETYAIRLRDAVFRGDCALDPMLRARQTASRGPAGDPRTSAAYQRRYKGQADRLKAYERAGILIDEPEAETISRETAMVGASLQAVVYSNTDRNLWVSYARLREDGSVEQAYEGTYHRIPFFDYLDPEYDQRALAESQQ